VHPTALSNAGQFFKTYLEPGRHPCRVVEVGSQDVNGSLRSVCPAGVEYVGVDFAAGPGVEIVLADPYQLPFGDASVDVCVSSSVFEHSEMFWLLFAEILRILRPDGLFYLNAPSNGPVHRFPVDCWRFYPDSGAALVNWGRRCKFNPALLESYTSWQKDDVWNDFVAVFLKDAAHAGKYPKRILDANPDFYNGVVYGSPHIRNPKADPEDMQKLSAIGRIVSGETKVR
jgi:SAM-dependent methyltransferase